MSLARAEEQTLARIESHLRISDPKLAFQLSVFARRPWRRKGPVRERISPWRPRPGRWWARSRVLAVAFAVAALGVLWGIVINETTHTVKPPACAARVAKFPWGTAGCSRAHRPSFRSHSPQGPWYSPDGPSASSQNSQQLAGTGSPPP